MANENANPTTYGDWAKTRDPDGNTADIVELLAETNPIIHDAHVVMGNKEDGHQETLRAGIPRGTWRKLNQGVTPSKTQNRQVKFGVGMLENYIEVDKDLADMNDDKAAFMLSESDGVMEGMNQDHMEALLYGDDTVNPEQFMGIMNYYNDATAASGRNIINGNPGGSVSGNDLNSSIYFVTWGRRTMFEIFPKGSEVGLKLRDLGEQTLFDASGGRFQGYRSHLKHNVGFVMRDWRYGVRIANLDSADIAGDLVPVIRLLIKAESKIQSRGAGTTVIYCGREVYSALDVKVNEKTNAALGMMEWDTKEIPSFRGMPIRMLDGISETELDVAGLPTAFT